MKKILILKSLLLAGLLFQGCSDDSTDTNTTQESEMTTSYSKNNEVLCSVTQKGTKIYATVKALDMTANSIASTWIKFDGETQFQLDNTIADKQGAASFEGEFEINKDVTEYEFVIKDHERLISEIPDDTNLTLEVQSSKNIVNGTSTTKGKCFFKNEIKEIEAS